MAKIGKLAKGSKAKSVKKRPAGSLDRRAKAGLTADDSPSTINTPRARNAFQLFYANALKKGSHTNATAASNGWSVMTQTQKLPWVEESLREKKEQLRAKGAHEYGKTCLRTAFARKAMSLTAPSPAESPKPDASATAMINAGNWGLTWVDHAKKKAIAGEGSSGCTHRGVHARTGVVGAIKMSPANAELRSECTECKHEVAMYKYIAEFDVNRRFLHIVECGVDAPIPYLVLPWAGLSLSSYFRQQTQQAGVTARLDPTRVVIAVATQTADALRFLHGKSCVHTDIKPSNLMIQSEIMQIVIIDFNAAERIDGQGWQPRLPAYSTFPYRAPELWNGTQRPRASLTRGLSAAVDVWSYGVTCVETIRGGASLFGGSGCEERTERLVMDFAKSAIALEKVVQSLPRSVGTLSGIHEIARCALQTTPKGRSLSIAMG